jgi:hypothetical protein
MLAVVSEWSTGPIESFRHHPGICWRRQSADRPVMRIAERMWRIPQRDRPYPRVGRIMAEDIERSGATRKMLFVGYG